MAWCLTLVILRLRRRGARCVVVWGVLVLVLVVLVA
jgi:hypothetical protein